MLKYRDIGKQIKIERIKQDMTQEQLAEMANISISHLSGIERGTTKLGLSALFGIANALKISTDVLLCHSIDNPVTRITLSNNIANILKSCSMNEIIFIEELIQSATDSLKKYHENCEESN